MATQWEKVDADSLKPEHRKAYEEYQRAFHQANDKGNAFKELVQSDSDYQQGLKPGEERRFNAIAGKLLFVTKAKAKVKEKRGAFVFNGAGISIRP